MINGNLKIIKTMDKKFKIKDAWENRREIIKRCNVVNYDIINNYPNELHYLIIDVHALKISRTDLSFEKKLNRYLCELAGHGIICKSEII